MENQELTESLLVYSLSSSDHPEAARRFVIIDVTPDENRLLLLRWKPMALIPWQFKRIRKSLKAHSTCAQLKKNTNEFSSGRSNPQLNQKLTPTLILAEHAFAFFSHYFWCAKPNTHRKQYESTGVQMACYRLSRFVIYELAR